MAETVDNPVSKVFERWKKKLAPLIGEENISMEDSETIAKAPYACLKMLGAPGARYDLEGDECATMPTFQVDSFATGQKALSMAYEIDAVSHKAMTDMGFRRYYGAEQVANIDSKIKRVVSRYRMLYTGNLLKDPEPETIKAKSRKKTALQ